MLNTDLIRVRLMLVDAAVSQGVRVLPFLPSILQVSLSGKSGISQVPDAH